MTQNKQEKAFEDAIEAKSAQERVYVVQRGDTLSKVAKEVYGNARRWPEIFEANKDKISDPSLIRPGQELRIPYGPDDIVPPIEPPTEPSPTHSANAYRAPSTASYCSACRTTATTHW